ncbi:MAG: right-handed parallel beta-helix repeat-containing protein [Verrucomicrobiota bacterium]
MTPQEARQILGLGPTDDPSAHLVDLNEARNRIAAMVASAPNETLGKRYQQGLDEFEAALAVMRSEAPGETSDLDALSPPPLPEIVLPENATATEPLEPTAAENDASAEVTISEAAQEKPIPPPAPTVVLGTIPAAASPESPPATEEAVPEPVRTSRALSFLAWSFVFLVGVAGGGWLFLKDQEAKRERMMTRAAFLERQGAILIENRRWQEAREMFAEIETLLPGSEMAMRGLRSIEVGMIDEQTQFLGYWAGQATAELEAGRLDEAEAAVRKVLDRFPNDPEAAETSLKIAAARKTQVHDALIAAARDALNLRKFDLAIEQSEKILATSPDDGDARSILDGARLAKAKVAADLEMAAQLYRKAAERDQGKFDQQAIDWIREAASLAPDDARIAALLEKLSGYTRTLQVPGEFATLDEALANARDKDRIVVAAGIWKGPLVMDVAVEIRGAGAAETIVECPPEMGSALTVGPAAKGVRVSGVSFRHASFAVGKDRFSAVLVRGGSATFSDCLFHHASGHGLAVIEAGQAELSRCVSSDNGWNGVAVVGEGSRLEMRESAALNNFEHGIESWQGAAAVLINNRCEGNSRNGIHADNGLASVEISGNQLVGNREFGLVLDSAGKGQVEKNTARDNLLGGLVIRAAAKSVRVTTNEATSNHGPGLVLEKGLPSSSYLANSLSKNEGEQLLAGMDFDIQVEIPPTEAPATPPGMTRTPPAPSEPAPPEPPRARIVTEP